MKLSDTNPGTIRWWVEYVVWKTTGFCYHPKRFSYFQRGWVRAGRSCDQAWAAERQWLSRGDLGPAHIRPNIEEDVCLTCEGAQGEMVDGEWEECHCQL